MQNRTTNCEASQRSDQMCCGKCGLAWDMNDQYPPECGKVSGIYPAAPVRDSQPAENLTPGITPLGYSIFVTYEGDKSVIVGWANSPAQMVAITLQALGYHGRHMAPSGMEVVVYREPDLDQMAFVPRQRVAFAKPECNRAHQILATGKNPTVFWDDYQIITALVLRKKLEAIR